MIVEGDSEWTGARSPGVVRHEHLPYTRVGSTSSGTGRGPAARASASFFNLRSTRRLWMRMTHRYVAEARTGALSPARAPFLPYTPASKRVRLSAA